MARGDPNYKLIFISVPDPFSDTYNKDMHTQQWDPKYDTLRQSEFSFYLVEGGSNSGQDFLCAYSTLPYARTEAIINISRTTFICVVLSIASIYFTKDAQTLVLDPLERMIEKVKLIAKNPLAAASDEVHEAGIMSFKNKEEKLDEKQKKEASQYETAVLERAIVKIGHLLALGFGEAGAGIIGPNMSNGGDLNPMMPGQKTYAIFGFCILNDFIDSTEVL